MRMSKSIYPQNCLKDVCVTFSDMQNIILQLFCKLQKQFLVKDVGSPKLDIVVEVEFRHLQNADYYFFVNFI